MHSAGRTLAIDRGEPKPQLRGRGTPANPPNRFSALRVEWADDGWSQQTDGHVPRTELLRDTSRRVLSFNRSPDVPFDRSINPYRGCEHGCVYCYARPTHAYLGFSPGLDFETRILYKPRAAELLRRELEQSSYRCRPLALGANTDAYQPVERTLQVTRQILEVLKEFRHPLTLITKSSLIERDLDLVAPMAEQGLAQVVLSFSTLDPARARLLEPRASSPRRRLRTIECLARAKVPVGVLVAPVIPGLTDHEMEQILTRARCAGASWADWVLLRLPGEIEGLFRECLETHWPLQAARIMQQIRSCRGGRYNDPRFGHRMRGSGVIAELLGQRFRLAHRRLEYGPAPALQTGLFRDSSPDAVQLSLF